MMTALDTIAWWGDRKLFECFSSSLSKDSSHSPPIKFLPFEAQGPGTRPVFLFISDQNNLLQAEKMFANIPKIVVCGPDQSLQIQAMKSLFPISLINIKSDLDLQAKIALNSDYLVPQDCKVILKFRFKQWEEVQALRDQNWDGYLPHGFLSWHNVFSLVFDEILTNAMKHGLKGQGEQHSDSPMPRASHVSTLIIKERRGIWLRVTDPLGGLSHRHTIECICRAQQSGQALTSPGSGSGLGLYFTYANSTSMIIEVSRGMTTAVTIFFESAQREKEYFLRTCNFHFREECLLGGLWDKLK
ncbi:MAG: ATP-binding protein [Bdellovibrionota bacterium]